MKRITALGALTGIVIGLASFAFSSPAQAHDYHYRAWQRARAYNSAYYVSPVAPVYYTPYANPYNPYVNYNNNLSVWQRLRLGL